MPHLKAIDEKEFNAHHEYIILESMPDNKSYIKFQKGPMQEFGQNGCQDEDLLEIVLDRLRSFQNSSFKCRENAIAITKIEEALHWLNHRTKDRCNRGVEGTNLA